MARSEQPEAVTGLDPARLPHCPHADVTGSLRARGLDVRPIPEADGATPLGLRAAVRDGRAVLCRGLVSHWPALTKWKPQQLAADHGDSVVRALMQLPASGVLFPADQQHYERTLPFAEFLKAMLSAAPDAPCYLAYKRAHEIFPSTDYDFASLLGDLDTDSDTRAWIGSAGTRSMLHSDLKDNLFVQVWGTKHVVLLPWRDSRSAYPFPDNVVNSQIDLADVDLERYPRMARAALYAGTVHPGDLLFIPRGWWHDLRASTPSVSLNHWFGAPLGLRDYLGLIGGLGPRCWAAVVRDFVRVGVLAKPEFTSFFFSPPSTGKRLFDALRWGNFSRDNDPST